MASSQIIENFFKKQLGKGAAKESLFTHIGDVFAKLSISGGFQDFEEISLAAKRSHQTLQDPPETLPSFKRKPDPWHSKSKALLAKPRGRVVCPDGKARLSVKKELGQVPELPKTATMLEWAGVSLGDDFEVYQIHLSLKHLAAKTGAQEIRFWGKIFARERDYIIAEGFVPNPFATGPKHAEQRGQVGANHNTYWVTDSVLDDWIELPDVLPEQIIAARDIKYILSGDLNAPVNTYPVFPGKERHLLRAQVARITHSCMVAPKDIYKEKEVEDVEDEKEFKEIEVSEEAKVPFLADLASLESWVHLPPYLLNAGRIAHLEPETPENPPDGWDAEAELQRLKEVDPQVAQLRFSPLSDENEAPLWQLKQKGDQQPYNLLSGEGTDSYATVVLKNTNWPGSVTVAHGGNYASVYVGFGVKAGGYAFSPVQPPDVMDDPVEPLEQPEPYPLEDPVEKPETDTDEPKEKEEEED